MVRVFKDNQSKWWLDGSLDGEVRDETLLSTYDALDDMPEELANKIAVLLQAEDHQTVDTIGRRINKTCFWVFM